MTGTEMRLFRPYRAGATSLWHLSGRLRPPFRTVVLPLRHRSWHQTTGTATAHSEAYGYLSRRIHGYFSAESRALTTCLSALGNPQPWSWLGIQAVANHRLSEPVSCPLCERDVFGCTEGLSMPGVSCCAVLLQLRLIIWLKCCRA